MSNDGRAPLFRAPLLPVCLIVSAGFAIGVAAFACGPNANEPGPKSGKDGMDKTEVTMEVSSFDAAAPTSSSGGTPGATTTATTTTAPSATAAASSSGGGGGGGSSDPSEEPNIGGVQKDAVVEKAVAKERPRLRACYKKALVIEPNLGGSATFDATIGKEGKVATVRFIKRNGLSEDMVGCLITAIKAMTFEGTAKSQIMTLTFGTPPPSTTASAATDAGAKR